MQVQLLTGQWIGHYFLFCHSKPREADCAPALSTSLPTVRISLPIWSLSLQITPYTSSITHSQHMGKKHVRGTLLSQVNLLHEMTEISKKWAKCQFSTLFLFRHSKWRIQENLESSTVVRNFSIQYLREENEGSTKPIELASQWQNTNFGSHKALLTSF